MGIVEEALLDDINELYDENFASNERLRNKPFADAMCEILLERFQPRSVVDLGCGTGDLLAPFERRKINILGIDGSIANKRHRWIREENFLLFDLRREYRPPRRYDLCLCLEVAEHIQPKYSRRLISNITACSDTIIFTAAPPGKVGVGHVNMRPLKWWRRLFREFGYVCDRRTTGFLKKRFMAASPKVYSWYIENLLVLKRCKSPPFFRRKKSRHEFSLSSILFIMGRILLLLCLNTASL